jgi:transcription antitermination factor NusG
MSWFVLYTAARAEKKVEARLKEMGVDVFLPIHRTKRKWSDRVKVVDSPLFNSYIFVRTPEHLLRELVLVYGVTKIIFYLGRPAVVRDEEIEAIKEFLNYAENKEIVSEGDRVEILSGIMGNKKGEVLRIKGDVVTLFLEELGAKICVSLSQVNKI